MTVKELISRLEKLPQNLDVYRESGDFKDDFVLVHYVEQQKETSLSRNKGIYLI